MLATGGKLGEYLTAGQTWYFKGELGAGKTTLIRGILRQLGYDGPVKSPTFTLVETYRFKNLELHHFDLYRIESAEELDFIGIRDYFGSETICLVEWPDRGKGYIPKSHWQIEIDILAPGRKVRLQQRTV